MATIQFKYKMSGYGRRKCYGSNDQGDGTGYGRGCIIGQGALDNTGTSYIHQSYYEFEGLGNGLTKMFEIYCTGRGNGAGSGSCTDACDSYD